MIQNSDPYLKYAQGQFSQHFIQKFNELEPFLTVDVIPDLPLVNIEIHQEVIIPNLIRCGAIPKKDLEIGATYLGSTRNATEAVWNGKKFEYQRYKFGMWFTESVNHFEDYSQYAVFIPIKKKTND